MLKCPMALPSRPDLRLRNHFFSRFLPHPPTSLEDPPSNGADKYAASYPHTKPPPPQRFPISGVCPRPFPTLHAHFSPREKTFVAGGLPCDSALRSEKTIASGRLVGFYIWTPPFSLFDFSKVPQTSSPKKRVCAQLPANRSRPLCAQFSFRNLFFVR